MAHVSEPMKGFVQLKRSALAAIASTHKLSDKDFHLLFNLVDRADFRSQSVSNFAFSTWATDFHRSAKTVSGSFKKLEALNLVSAVKQPRNGLTVTILCWNEVVKGVKTKSGETAPKSGEVALKSGETAPKSGETALENAKTLTTAKKYAPKIEDRYRRSLRNLKQSSITQRESIQCVECYGLLGIVVTADQCENGHAKTESVAI